MSAIAFCAFAVACDEIELLMKMSHRSPVRMLYWRSCDPESRPQTYREDIDSRIWRYISRVEFIVTAQAYINTLVPR